MEWTPEKVAQRFEECVWVLHRMPDGGGSSSIGYWPKIIYTQQELNRQPPRPLRLRPLPDAIDRCEETLKWILYVREEYRNIIWLRAYRTPWREISRQTGFTRTSAQRYWVGELREVARCLVSMSCSR